MGRITNGDSIADLPVLEAVGNPVVVNPRRICGASRSNADGPSWISTDHPPVLFPTVKAMMMAESA